MYPDPAFLKYFNWDVKKDPKGCQKAKSLSVAKMTSTKNPKMNSCRLKKMVKKKREVSVLRSSPSRPSGGRGRGAASDLLSPPRRAPTVTGLSSLISSSVSVSPAATSPNVDTPTRRRARRRRGLLRCRNRNQGCTDNVTFTTEDARNQHERYTCRALSQVNVFQIYLFDKGF